MVQRPYELTEREGEALEVLAEVARAGRTITYRRLWTRIGSSRRWIGNVLGNVSEFERLQGRPYLSAIVVLNDSETRICPKGTPSGGFLGLDEVPDILRRAERQYRGSLSREDETYIADQQRKVWAYWKVHK